MPLITAVDKIIDEILRAEGSKYTNDPNDAGGPTRYGITQRTLSGYRGRQVSPQDVADLTEAEARQIYFKMYVKDPGFEPLVAKMPKLAARVVDAGVNCGPTRAAAWLQVALNAFNQKGEFYSDIAVDGKVGPATYTALQRLVDKRGANSAQVVLIRAFNAQQGSHYLNILSRQANETFAFGWFMNRISE